MSDLIKLCYLIWHMHVSGKCLYYLLLLASYTLLGHLQWNAMHLSTWCHRVEDGYLTVNRYLYVYTLESESLGSVHPLMASHFDRCIYVSIQPQPPTTFIKSYLSDIPCLLMQTFPIRYCSVIFIFIFIFVCLFYIWFYYMTIIFTSDHLNGVPYDIVRSYNYNTVWSCWSI